METSILSIIDFLSDNKIIKIPCWHRDFVWDMPYVLKFFDDIEALINKSAETSHFLGTIIYSEEPEQLFTINIIDGQQRLITVSLFLNALFNHFQNKRYKGILLFRGNNTDIPKIEISSLQKENYNELLYEEEFAYANNSKYSQAYRALLSRVESAKYTLSDYFDALKKINIVALQADKAYNQQVIFDDINSLSIKLSKFEKIKNYMFIGLKSDEQDKILKNYWLPLTQLFSESAEDFIDYLISYVSMQSSDKKIDVDNIFTEFNKFYFYKRKYKDVNEIISELFKFAQYYIRIKNADFTRDIAVEMEKITSLAQSPQLYAFLFELTDDFQNKLIPKQVFIDVLKNVYSYMKTSVDNNEAIDFTTLSQTISKLLAQKYE